MIDSFIKNNVFIMGLCFISGFAFSQEQIIIKSTNQPTISEIYIFETQKDIKDINLQNWRTPIIRSDTALSVLRVKERQQKAEHKHNLTNDGNVELNEYIRYNISLINLKHNELLSLNNLIPITNDGEFVSIISGDVNLNNISHYMYNNVNNFKPFLVPQREKGCQFIAVTYRPTGENTPITKTKFFDLNGQKTNKIDNKCREKINIGNRSIYQSKSGALIHLSKNQKKINKTNIPEIKIKAFLSGAQLYLQSPKGYLINKNLKDVFILNARVNKESINKETVFYTNHAVPNGDYYVIIEHYMNNINESIKSSISVR